MATTSNSANFVMNVPELVSMVFEYFDSREDVFKASLINKACREAALPILYRDIEIKGDEISFSYDEQHRDIFESVVAAWLPLNASLPSILVHARHGRHLAISGCAPEVAMQIMAATVFLDQLRIDLRGRSDGRPDDAFAIPTEFLTNLPATLALLHLDLSPEKNGMQFGITEIRPLLEAVTSPPHITSLEIVVLSFESALLAAEKLGTFAETVTLLAWYDGTAELSMWQRLFRNLPRLRELEGYVDIAPDQLLPVLRLLPPALEVLDLIPTQFDTCWRIFEAMADPSLLPNLRAMPEVALDDTAGFAPGPVNTTHITALQAERTIKRALAGLEARKYCQLYNDVADEWYSSSSTLCTSSWAIDQLG